MANDPTNGVQAGIEAARGATSSVDGVPPSVLNTARQIALQTGGNPAAVSKFMTQQGYPQHAGEWCGDFAAAVVHASGGTPPSNSAAAGAWANFGSLREGGPQPGDVAVMRGKDNNTGLPYTHVTFVDGVNPDGTFIGLGGNQGGGLLKRSVFNTSGFEFRNPGTTINSFTLPKNAPMGMGNNNPLNIQYYKGAETDYSGVVGPSENTDQGTPQIKFATPEAGWNAAYSLLNKKYTRGMTTPNMIIAGKGGWTPGNTEAAANVAKSAGIGPNDDIGFADPAKAAKFMRALVTQEQGSAGSAYPDTMIASAIGGKSAPSGASAAPDQAGLPASAVAAQEAQRAAAAPAVASGATGTTAGGPPAGAGSFGGFKTQADADAFQKSAKGLEKAMGKGGGDAQGQGGPPDIQPSQMIGPPPSAMNVSPLLAMVPMTYGQTINSLQDPLTWNSNPPGRPPPAPQPGAGVGRQGPMGTSLNSMAMMDPNMAQFPQSPITGMGYMGMGYGYPGGGMPYG